MDTMFEALKKIRDARDYCAEHGRYPADSVGEGQSFDDWAADVAESAMAAPSSTTDRWHARELDPCALIDENGLTVGNFSVAEDAALAARAPAMHALLTELLDYKREQFDGQGDLNISNADVVDWLTTFRERARASLI